jgi:hypothetical protein
VRTAATCCNAQQDSARVSDPFANDPFTAGAVSLYGRGPAAQRNSHRRNHNDEFPCSRAPPGSALPGKLCLPAPSREAEPGRQCVPRPRLATRRNPSPTLTTPLKKLVAEKRTQLVSRNFCRTVGKYRRVRLDDLTAYKRKDDEAWAKVVDQLTAEAHEFGMGY